MAVLRSCGLPCASSLYHQAWFDICQLGTSFTHPSLDPSTISPGAADTSREVGRGGSGGELSLLLGRFSCADRRRIGSTATRPGSRVVRNAFRSHGRGMRRAPRVLLGRRFLPAVPSAPPFCSPLLQLNNYLHKCPTILPLHYVCDLLPPSLTCRSLESCKTLAFWN